MKGEHGSNLMLLGSVLTFGFDLWTNGLQFETCGRGDFFSALLVYDAAKPMRPFLVHSSGKFFFPTKQTLRLRRSKCRRGRHRMDGTDAGKRVRAR